MKSLFLSGQGPSSCPQSEFGVSIWLRASNFADRSLIKSANAFFNLQKFFYQISAIRIHEETLDFFYTQPITTQKPPQKAQTAFTMSQISPAKENSHTQPLTTHQPPQKAQTALHIALGRLVYLHLLLTPNSLCHKINLINLNLNLI